MRQTRRFLVAIGSAAALAHALAGCATPQPWEHALVSVDADGTDGGNGNSSAFYLDGYFFEEPQYEFVPNTTKIVFTSLAGDLGAVDTNDQPDVYLYDYETADTTLISARSDGTDSGNGSSYDPVASPDGTTIAFVSEAFNLVPTDAGNQPDVYLYDLATGTTDLVSIVADGTRSGGGVHPAFSPDSASVAFSSVASDLVPDRFICCAQNVYLRDLLAATNRLVSENATQTDGGNGASDLPVFSPDGNSIAFESLATNLGPRDTDGTDQNRFDDVYVRNLATGTTSLVSANAVGNDSGDGQSGGPVFSPDGTRIAFWSEAPNLGPDDNNGFQDIYIRDLTQGSTLLVSANVQGAAGNRPSGQRTGFSPDGTQIVFWSEASDFGPLDTNGREDVYLRDLDTGTTRLVSANAQGSNSGNGASFGPVFSPDGTKVAFTSTADDLGPHDGNSTSTCSFAPGAPKPCSDVYERDLTTNTTTLVSTNVERTDSGDEDSNLPVYGPDHLLAFSSLAENLGPADINGNWDIYLAIPVAA